MKVDNKEVKKENDYLLLETRKALYLLTNLKADEQKELFTIGNRVFRKSIHDEITQNEEVVKMVNAINALEGNTENINKKVQLTSTLVS